MIPSRTRPDYLVDMAQRPAPSGCGVVAGSTPVVAFGDPARSKFATLGINPSKSEFTSADGATLTGTSRRLATRESLGVIGTDALPPEAAGQVVDDCLGYFHRNPYRRWFDPLDEILGAAFGVSYYEDTACHLDIVQWATDPVWGQMADSQAQGILRDEGAPHLKRLLESSAVETVVVNGKAVWDLLERTGLATVKAVKTITYGSGSKTTTLCIGEGCGVRFVGWTLNLQSTPGVRKQDRVPLATWLRPIDRSVVHSQHEFTTVLREWAATSDAETIGDTRTFGGKWAIKLHLGDGRVVALNADTTRQAVLSYLDHAKQHGEDSPWRVFQNSRGRINKVDFAASGPATAGWYCYLTPDAASPGTLGQPDFLGVVQFPHPGAEHQTINGRTPWNDGDHGRKFLLSNGSWRDRDDRTHSGELAFWGEWEPPSEVVTSWPDDGDQPRSLVRPQLPKQCTPGKQNTDPYVFGDHFRYALCKQFKQTGQPESATYLARLAVGTMILFGSKLGRRFVLDTVLVVESFVGYTPATWAEDTASVMTDQYRQVTFERAFAELTDQTKARPMRLYKGATPDRPVNGMYSFFPCLPAAGDQQPRFARPTITLDGFVNATLSMGSKKEAASSDAIAKAWADVRQQVLDAGLMLGVAAEEP